MATKIRPLLVFSATLFVFAVAALCSMVSKFIGPSLRVIYVTVPNKEVALNISRAVVQKKLAACVNIVPGLTSVYEWQDKVHEDEELLMIIKTQEGAIPNLQKEITTLHPYDVPEFISLPIDHASEPYGKWVAEQTSRTST